MRFFKPNEELLKSLVEYANGRVIVDVGCGDCDVIVKLRSLGAAVLGFEPFLSQEAKEKTRNAGIMIIEDYVQKWPTIISEIKEKGLLLFARPCHSDFVYDCIDIKDPLTEALYITMEENLTKYCDLGYFEQIAKRISLKGNSEDNEIILSIC